MARGIRACHAGRATSPATLNCGRLPAATPCASSAWRSTAAYKDASGQWVEKASFFDVVVWGAQGENCARYLSKGRQVAIDGRLDQRSWDAQDGSKRSKVEIIADNVVFVGGNGGETREPVFKGGEQPARETRSARRLS